MIKSREAIPAQLEHALIANRVLAALASNDLTSQESQDAVEDAIQFLGFVLQGEELASSRSIRADSYKAALAYGEGVRVFELVGYEHGRAEDPSAYLKAMQECASSLRRHDQAPEKAVEDLRTFFSNIRDIALASTESPLEKVSW